VLKKAGGTWRVGGSDSMTVLVVAKAEGYAAYALSFATGGSAMDTELEGAVARR